MNVIEKKLNEIGNNIIYRIISGDSRLNNLLIDEFVNWNLINRPSAISILIIIANMNDYNYIMIISNEGNPRHDMDKAVVISG